MVPISDITTLKSVYFAYFHSVIKCRIIWGGNSSSSAKIFSLRRKIVRILAVAQPRTLCRSLFKKLEIFTNSIPICNFITEFHFQE
jgi:hypothetical protein